MAMFRSVFAVVLVCLAAAQLGDGTKIWCRRKNVRGILSQRQTKMTRMTMSKTERVSFIKKKLEHIDSDSSSSSESNEGSDEIHRYRDVRFLQRYGDIRRSSYDEYMSLVHAYYGLGYGIYRLSIKNPKFATDGYYNVDCDTPIPNYVRRGQSYAFPYPSGYQMIGQTGFKGSNSFRSLSIQKKSYGNPYNPMLYSTNYYGSFPRGWPRDICGPSFTNNQLLYSANTDIFGRSLQNTGLQFFSPQFPPMTNFGLPNYYNGYYSRGIDIIRGEYEYINSYNEFKFDRYGIYQLKLFEEFFHALDQERFNIIKDIKYPPDFTPQLRPDAVFDFIIVGAGPTGCLLANLLSQNFNWNVLLIEAGGHPPPAAEIPLFYTMLSGSEFDWNHKIEVTDTVGLGMRNGEIKLHCGKALGGSAVTTANLYYRGCVRDYQLMVESGLIEYGFDKLIRFFIKTEHLRSSILLQLDDIRTYHGTDGLLPVSKITSRSIKYVSEVYAAGFSELGYKQVMDINDAKYNTGYMDMLGHVLKGRRMLPAKVFLSPIIQRSNFKLLIHTLVTKVLIDSKTNTAYGVELVTKHGQMFTVQATKEVIVTAGAIGSAQLLMLSGIGPRHQLLLHEIDLIKDLNVGGNLKLNAQFTGAVMAHEKSLTKHVSVEDMAFSYLAHNDGPLATFGTFNQACFIDTLTKGYPEVEFHHFYFPQHKPEWLCDFKAMFNYADEYRTKLAKLNDKDNLGIYTLALLQPYSTGRVILGSKNPFDKAVIIGNLLSDERDVESLLIALEKISKLENTEAFQSVGSRMVPIEVSECDAFEFKSKDYWKCALKYFTTTTFKPCGTCQMGLSTDPNAVVDQNGLVYGVSNLRVVGSAILPRSLSAYSSTPTYMLAEKVAENIMLSYSI